MSTPRAAPILSLGAVLLAAPLAVQTQPKGDPAALATPRHPFTATLRPIWRSDRGQGLAQLQYPFDVRFASDGLLIFDYGAKQFARIAAANGKLIARVGQAGSGPGELTGQSGLLFGPMAEPHFIEHGNGRIVAYRNGVLSSIVSAGGGWTTACTWGTGQMLFRRFAATKHDYVIATIGAGARVVDSLQAPWPDMLREHILVRQSFLQQVDDSTCAILPNYFRHFALVAPERPPILGLHVEILPKPSAVLTKRNGAEEARMARGARRGALDMRAWRGYLLVLFSGSSAHRGRLLDLYTRDGLRYAGSLVLPHNTLRMAVRGDTLVAVGDVDGDPVVSAYLLTSQQATGRRATPAAGERIPRDRRAPSPAAYDLTGSE